MLPTGERLFGDNAIHLPKAGIEIKNPYNADGIVEDWETAEKLWEYTITSRLTGARQTPPSKNGLNDAKDENGDTNMDEGLEQLEEQEKPLQEFPLLMSEPAWNPAKERQKAIEIAMETWGVPAFFLAKNGQLASYVTCTSTIRDKELTGYRYSQSKATALVVDIGALNTSVTALWDGMVLQKSECIHSSLQGWLRHLAICTLSQGANRSFSHQCANDLHRLATHTSSGQLAQRPDSHHVC